MGSETPETGGTRSKVVALLDRYELSSVGEKLERSWTGAGAEQRSLRDLATYLNTELVTAALQDAGMDVLEGEAENIYRLLTSDEVSPGDRIQTRNRLEAQGVDVDQLTEDFVSRQAIHTYLTQVRDVTYPEDSQSPSDRIQTQTDTIQRLRSRLVQVCERSLENLSEALTMGDVDVLVSVRVRCTNCGTQTEITDFLTSGGCDCDPTGE